MSTASNSEKVLQGEPGPSSVPEPTIHITEHQVGVWKLKIAETSLLDARKYREEFQSALPLFWRLATDIVGISPGLITLHIICQLWSGLDHSFQMYLSNKLLRIVEISVISGKPNAGQIIMALMARLLATVVSSFLQWYGSKVYDQVQNRVTRHFQLFLIKSDLGVDLPTSQEHGSKQESDATRAWGALERIIDFFRDLLRAFSQLALIISISRSIGGPLFVLLCISHPLASHYFGRSYTSQVSLAYTNNADYQRMKALKKFSNGHFRQDIISGGLKNWIVKQYETVHANLGELDDRHPHSILAKERSPFLNMAISALGDLPMAFCAINAIVLPHKFSVASIAILQQSSTTLRLSFRLILRTARGFRNSISSVKAIYASSNIVNSMHVGDVAYPRDEKASSGMSFELKNVSFSYPGTQNTELALRDISLNIKPGHLVVVVGANGSGKSTLIRILSRLYDPTSGQVLIDGLPSQEYRVEDLHRATALLSQDNTIYPLSLGENIGLGYPNKECDEEMVAEAAQQGGAFEFISKFKDGFRTFLDPDIELYYTNLMGKKHHPLYIEMEQLPKEIDISGGEKQRVVAARTFMRFKSGNVKFVAVDEPSSALDAEGELKLFANLMNVREGKTMVFVTHRFGHLTKHADIIICMKDGYIAETGSHEELLTKNGEYAKLYQIQAGAFSQ